MIQAAAKIMADPTKSLPTRIPKASLWLMLRRLTLPQTNGMMSSNNTAKLRLNRDAQLNFPARFKNDVWLDRCAIQPKESHCHMQ
jgi:hypothetical protein